VTAARSEIESKRERLRRALIETGAFKWSPTPVFPLASGAMSRFYVDCRSGLSYPELRALVGELMWAEVKDRGIDAVGGLLVGAYPIAVAVSDAAFRVSGKVVRAFTIRKEPKEHGLRRLIEGDVRAGDRALVVDDVITSGKSTIDAIRKCREGGLIVERAMAIVDRQEQNGRGNIEAEGVSATALCTLGELQESAGASSPRTA
jgi:orotate phosphoribosyltransferase